MYLCRLDGYNCISKFKILKKIKYFDHVRNVNHLYLKVILKTKEN